MGGKTTRSTQAISIPPEVLARYNAINARADTVTTQPFQYYQGQFVAPLTATQQAGIANTNAASNMAQSYYGNATNQLNNAQQGVTPYYQNATSQLNQGVTAGNQYANQSSASLNNALNAGNQYATQSSGSLNNALNVGNQYAGQSSNTLNAAYGEGSGIQRNALNNLGAAYASAQPYNQAAGGLYQQGLAQGSDITNRSLAGTQQALAGAQPYQGIATNYMTSGAQAVNPTELGADEINRYMSPFLGTVLQGTAGLLNQQNQQQQAGQMGNAIRSGAFGGDRGGIAAANLNQQQNLANAQIFSGLLNQGYGQALNTAQQQQQLNLGASQANRAAQQQAAQQALAIGQQGFGQGLAAAQQQGALGQQLFNMNNTTGQNTAALGQQVYGQGTNTAQQQSAVGNTLFNQGATTAAQQAALGQQQFAQNATAAQQQAALGQQQFAQSATAAQQQAALGQQLFNQGNTAAGTSAALGSGLYNIGANTASQLAALGTGAQTAALQGAAAQMTAGQAQQATQQAENNALYNQFLQAQSLPYQQLQLASNIALGTGTAQGSTTTTTQPGGFFSDERLKENIKAVGKTFDGQTIHSYNYKGDPRTQIGLIAQEVQKHHPEAVGLAGGYKTVDYDKATEDAADRGHMASGGLASAGGSVMPYNAGQGFSNGGLAGYDPAVMQQMLEAQQAMYAPLTSGGIYAGGPNAGGGLVPQSSFAPSQLMTPSALPQRATGAEQAKTMVDLGSSINKFGEGIGAWGDDKKPEDDKYRISKDLLKEIGVLSDTERAEDYAMGGGIPYGGQGLDIPTDALAGGSNGPMTAGNLPGQQSGLDKLSKVANVADTGMKLGKFGQKIGLFSTGGTPYGGQGLDIPEGDDLDASRQPMTAASLEKPESGLSKTAKVAQIAGTVAKVAAMFSDKRLKENIKPIGKLFDGQIVHSYNYKGDPRTQIGLLAQEVEGHKPHAVGLAGKYKTVDYAKATSGAAKRGHFAMGGEPTAGLMGAEMAAPEENEQGFDFNLDPEDLIAGNDSHFESLLRRKPEAAPQRVDNFAASNKKFREELEARKNAPRDQGLAGAPKAAGLLPVPASLPKDLSGIAKIIFAAEGDGQAKTSSALGRYGIVKDTYVSYFKKAFPQQARELGDAGIRALRTTPEGRKLNLQFGPMIIADNAKHLRKYGFDTNARNVYLAHFLGPSGAVRALRADPNTPVELAVDKDAITANPDVFAKRKIRTVGELINWTGNTMAKRAKEIGFASGGLAGRDGYQDGGVPKTEEELAEEITAATPIQTVTPEPSRRKEGGLGAAGPDATSVAASTPADAKPNATGVAPPVVEDAEKKPPVVDDIVVTAKLDPRGKPQEAMRKTIFGRGRQNPVSLEGGAVAPYSYDYLSEPFFKGIKRGSAGSIIPLLTGIAAMGTAPTRSLGVALATGLGAGAQSYQNLANERNKQLPVRQAAAAKQAEVARTLADQFFRLAPDGKNFTFTKPGAPPGEDTFLVTPGQKQAMIQQMLTGSGQYMPDVPEGAQLYTPTKTVRDVVKFKSATPPSDNSVEGIVAGANANPNVAQYFNERAQAQADMAAQQELLGSQYASPSDIELAQTRLVAAQSRYATADKAYMDAFRAVADPKLQAFNTSVANIGSANLDTYAKAEDIVLKNEAIRNVVGDIKKLLDSGQELQLGATTSFWNRVASAALANGAPANIVGSGQTNAQRIAALSTLLEGTGISPASLSVENSTAAVAAVVGVLDRNIRTADERLERAKKSLYPTATPSINNANTRTATATPATPPASPAGAPAAVPGTSGSQKASGPKRAPGISDLPNSTPQNPMVYAPSYQAAVNDPTVKNGTKVYYRDANGKMASKTMQR
jgi:hypothetical protein